MKDNPCRVSYMMCPFRFDHRLELWWAVRL